jgi:hypothetical protein
VPKPEAPAASTIIVSFFLMLLVLVLLGCIANSCGRDEDLKRAREEGYQEGHYDGYWKAQAEHGVF